MVYVFIETCITPTTKTSSLECTLPIITSLKHRLKSIVPFRYFFFLFHHNFMWLPKINNKLANNPHSLVCNIKSYAYHFIHETSDNILKWDKLHLFKVYITLRPISFKSLQLVVREVCNSLFWAIPNCFNILLIDALVLVQTKCFVLLNMIYLYP
jgi:hypothetical protein